MSAHTNAARLELARAIVELEEAGVPFPPWQPGRPRRDPRPWWAPTVRLARRLTRR